MHPTTTPTPTDSSTTRPSPASLTSLPPELLSQILSYLPYPSLSATSLAHSSLIHISQTYLWSFVEFYSPADLALALSSASCGKFQIRTAVFGGSLTDEQGDDPQAMPRGVKELIARVEGWTDVAIIGVTGLGVDVLGLESLKGLTRLRIGATLLPSATPVVPHLKLDRLHLFRGFDLSTPLSILLCPPNIPPTLTTFLPSALRPSDPSAPALDHYFPLAAPHLLNLTLSFTLDSTPALLRLLSQCTRVQTLELAYVKKLSEVLAALPSGRVTLRELGLRSLARFEPPSEGLAELCKALALEQLQQVKVIRLLALHRAGVEADAAWSGQFRAFEEECARRGIEWTVAMVEP